MSYAEAQLPKLFRRRPLALCAAAMAALTSPAIALGVAVTNCNDVGPNSLRAGIAATATGGTVDLSTLTCSTITLEDAQITVPQNDLTLVGPAAGVTIAHDGNYDRIFNHQGTGTFKLKNVNVTGGDRYSTTQNVTGGCIYSKGDVYLADSDVLYCTANAVGHIALGGGVYTRGNLTLFNSEIVGNVAGSHGSTAAQGGGARVLGNLNMVYSSIRKNSAVATQTDVAIDGGVAVFGNFSVSASTISGNSAGIAGGLGAFDSGTGIGSIQSSTISGNHAGHLVGGAFLQVPTTIRNSTIAFNSAVDGKLNADYFAPGVTFTNSARTIAVVMDSTIVSNNTYVSNGASIENDFSKVASATTDVTISGHHNLVVASTVTFPPGVVPITACPLLGPLRNNGGITLTHALSSHSPAIDTGSNPVVETFDQRGPQYLRMDAIAKVPDIGAYEVQQQDAVFSAGFDGC